MRAGAFTARAARGSPAAAAGQWTCRPPSA